MADKYILDGKNVVPEANLEKWAAQFGNDDRRVGYDTVGDKTVSTVFLGIDHAFGGGPPLLFETMVFDA